MTKLEQLESEIERLKQIVDELTIEFFNLGSIERLKADLDNIAQLPEKERHLAIENLYNNCVTPLEKLYLDIESLKGKMTDDVMKDLRKYIKTKEIKLFSYN